MSAITFFKRSFIGALIACFMLAFLGSYEMVAFGIGAQNGYFRLALISMAFAVINLIMYFIKSKQAARA